MSQSRTYNSIRNSAMTVVAQMTSIVFNFIGRTVFIHLLNVDYLGVNGLFSNILALLSLAEMGIGTAIVYMMYDPISKKNIAKVAAYNKLFKKTYNIIGCSIFFLGLCILPFLDFIIKDAPNIDENLDIIYILFLTNTTVSYFFTYKRSLLTAYQKEYLNSTNIIIFAIIRDIALIVVLLIWKDFYLYLVTQIIVTIASNFAISVKVDLVLPEIKATQPSDISPVEKKTIGKNVLAMLCHKLGSIVVSGTDNIIISSFVGISTVGLFSNYKMIQKIASQIISQATNAVTASVGNLISTGDNQRVYEVFEKIYFINMTMAFFVSGVFFGVIGSFVKIWIGNEYLIPQICVFLLAFNLYLNQIRVPSQVIINAYGLFWNIKWKSIVEASLNLIISLLLVWYFDMGLFGILLGTILCNILTNVWWEPYVAFKNGMKRPLVNYWLIFTKDIIIIIGLLFLQYQANKYFDSTFNNIYISFIVSLILSTLICCLVYYIFYRKSKNLFYIKFIMQNLIKEINNKVL